MSKKGFEPEQITLNQLYTMQLGNQLEMLQHGMYEGFTDMEDIIKTLPFDNIKLSSYHMQQLVSEIGEILDADKRWKNIRNGKYNRQQKLEELADCFIVLMNICMFSGFNAKEVASMIQSKINIVSQRIEAEASKEA